MTLCGQDISLLLLSVVITALSFATPITLGALSGVICERAGVVNIAIEGMMLSGAFGGYWAAVTFHSLPLAVLSAVLVGGLMALLHGWLSITYKVDQIISGTVINILGFGITSYLFGQWYSRGTPTSPGTLPTIQLPGGRELQSLALVAIILVFVLYAVLQGTAWGLRVRAVGENPHAADTVGVNVRRVRYSAVLVGGLLAGLGGAAYVPGYIPAFSPGMTNGYGFIALAAMIFGKWNPIGAWLATLFFGLTLSIQNNLQSCKVVEGPVPVGLVGMLPYIVTLLVLAGFVGRSTPPAADGVPF
ncbi:MAG: ABC transporter permease [Chloroflexota bacterium]|nr:ABC transporter permease [Chloroflexota bacterium]